MRQLTVGKLLKGLKNVDPSFKIFLNVDWGTIYRGIVIDIDKEEKSVTIHDDTP